MCAFMLVFYFTIFYLYTCRSYLRPSVYMPRFRARDFTFRGGPGVSGWTSWATVWLFVTLFCLFWLAVYSIFILFLCFRYVVVLYIFINVLKDSYVLCFWYWRDCVMYSCYMWSIYKYQQCSCFANIFCRSTGGLTCIRGDYIFRLHT